MESNALTIREQVTNRIRDDVIAGNFPAERPLREVELAKKFQVSRGPIRDAFLTLSQEGFLAYQSNRGVTVRRPPDPEHRPFIVSIRRQIESYVVASGIETLDEEQLATIDAALLGVKNACVGHEVVKVARADMAFHEAILIASGGSDFLPIWKWLCSQMMLTYSRLDHYEEVFEEHLQIMQALRTRDLDACLAALEVNIR